MMFNYVNMMFRKANIHEMLKTVKYFNLIHLSECFTIIRLGGTTMSNINNGTMSRVKPDGTLSTFGSVQSINNEVVEEAINTIGNTAQTAVQTINSTVTTATNTLDNTVQEAVQDIDDEVSDAKQEIAAAAGMVVQYDVPVICPNEDVGCVLIKNAELGDTETIEVFRPTGEPTTTPIRIGTSLADCSLINVGDTLAHWKEYGATEIKFGYQSDDYCYRDEVGDVFSTVKVVLGTIDREQPVTETFEYPSGTTGTDYVCKITPTEVENANKSATTQTYTIEVTDENIALYANTWFGVYTYNLTVGTDAWFHDYAAKYGTIWVTTSSGEVVRYTGKSIDFSQLGNTDIISDAYNISKSYVVGEYCIYLNELYKCIANTTAGILPTDTTYFIKTRIDNEVSALDSSKANTQDPRFNGYFRIGEPQGDIGDGSFATGYDKIIARNTVFNYDKTTKILELQENSTIVEVGTPIESVVIMKADYSAVSFDVTGVVLSKTQARIDSGFDVDVTDFRSVQVHSRLSNVASGANSHADGFTTTASGSNSHAEGSNTTASGANSHAEGSTTTASDINAHAEGNTTTASGRYSHAEGYKTEASNANSHAGGHYNTAMTTGGTSSNTTGTAFVIGNGTSDSSLSNAFSVQFSGVVKAKSTITASTTADYAEFFEWLDENPNNEDRVGHFVTLDGNKIRIATDKDDYILGVVSGEPFVLGNGDCDVWNGMYLHDEFRRTMTEPAPKMIEIIDEEGNPTGEYKEVEGEYEGTRFVLNPEYDPNKPYTSRFDRQEWSPVGMLGVLPVIHDGTAKVNGYVTVNKDGIATACDKNSENSYRVIKSSTDTVVEIIFR